MNSLLTFDEYYQDLTGSAIRTYYEGLTLFNNYKHQYIEYCLENDYDFQKFYKRTIFT